MNTYSCIGIERAGRRWHLLLALLNGVRGTSDVPFGRPLDGSGAVAVELGSSLRVIFWTGGVIQLRLIGNYGVVVESRSLLYHIYFMMNTKYQ